MQAKKLKTEEAREMLLTLANGGRQYYEINAYVDAKGIITIMGCKPLKAGEARPKKNFIVLFGGDNDIYYYEGADGRTYGRELAAMAHKAAARLTDDDYYSACMQFCSERPQDVGRCLGAMVSTIANNDARYWEGSINNGLRTDYADVVKELRRRNCSYMKEFFNVDVPEDLDCEADAKAKARRQ